MRTIDADLLAVQSTDIQPAIQAIFKDKTGATITDYSFNPTVTTNRWWSIVHRESSFEEYAEILLRNEDLAVPDLRGYYVDVGYGANTGSASVTTLTLRPDGVGSETSIPSTDPAGQPHWQMVDEVTADDGTTYVYNFPAAYARDLYALPNHTSETGLINKVTVYFRVYYGSGRLAKSSIKTNDVVYDGTEKSSPAGWSTNSQEYTLNPQTGLAWTWAEIDALEAGVSVKGTVGLSAGCTQVYVEVNYNYTTGGLLYSAAPRLWVKDQAYLSSSIKLSGQASMKVILALTGVWRMMAEQPVLIGTAPYYQDENEVLEGKTVYGILEYLIETSFSTQVGYTFTLNALGAADDNIINDYVPEITHDPENPFINANGIESYLSLIKRVIAMSKCKLRAKGGLAFEIVYPQSTDAYDETYYSSMAHYFYEHKNVESVVTPNHVIVYGLNADGTVAKTGNWYNPDDYSSPPTFSGKYTPVKYVRSLYSTLQWEVDNYAAALGSSFQSTGSQGRIVIPHDSRVELYDRIKVFDTRNQ